MNTIWLKIAGIAVAVVVVIILIGVFKGSGNAPSPPVQEDDHPKTFEEAARRDRQLLQPPKPVEGPAEGQHPEAAAQPSQPPEPSQATATASGVVRPSSITKPTPLYFKPLDEIDNIEAERILNVTVPGRSIGRLPMTGYKLMVDGCRQLLQRWPDSWYAFRAKQMLEEMPERFWQNYRVTEAEIDISKFFKQRPDTLPMTVEPLQ